jgi:hypothetical protein
MALGVRPRVRELPRAGAEDVPGGVWKPTIVADHNHLTIYFNAIGTIAGSYVGNLSVGRLSVQLS